MTNLCLHRSHQNEALLIPCPECGETWKFVPVRDSMVLQLLACRAALQVLVKEYVANRGTGNEFIQCVTPEGIPDYWRNAMQVLDLSDPDG